jgi:hypothetical protein
LEIGIELAGEEAHAQISHALLFCLQGGLACIEAVLVGRKLPTPTLKHAGNLFFFLLQLLLPLSHHSLPLADSDRARVEVLLLLDSGVGTGLNRGVQLFGTRHQLLGIGVEQTNVNSLLIEQVLHLIQQLPLHHRPLPLGAGMLLEQGTPLRETLPLFFNIDPLSLEHILRLA